MTRALHTASVTRGQSIPASTPGEGGGIFKHQDPPRKRVPLLPAVCRAGFTHAPEALEAKCHESRKGTPWPCHLNAQLAYPNTYKPSSRRRGKIWLPVNTSRLRFVGAGTRAPHHHTPSGGRERMGISPLANHHVRRCGSDPAGPGWVPDLPRFSYPNLPLRAVPLGPPPSLLPLLFATPMIPASSPRLLCKSRHSGKRGAAGCDKSNRRTRLLPALSFSAYCLQYLLHQWLGGLVSSSALESGRSKTSSGRGVVHSWPPYGLRLLLPLPLPVVRAFSMG
ncbi:uncharacterized protein LY79DRAFT_142178 [Colletotrichum navitas]|uniref:Uncharacterized protein n=1 Tax=Colletotrichum navitas TaxID=681940 RepID=A0AAD8QDI3_9PEZI|nr:uncharacterized protein LY79DRAFT_142178 [Colletotrichum navitas]KAK1599487.1 hypothetical protein LY79DRAFT_142178 [Colletotrichum navitas]